MELRSSSKDVQQVMERVGRTLDTLYVSFLCQADVPKNFGSPVRGSAQRSSGDCHASVHCRAPRIDLRGVIEDGHDYLGGPHFAHVAPDAFHDDS